MTPKAIRRILELAVLTALLLIGLRSFVVVGWIVPLAVHGNSMAPHYLDETITASRLQTPKRWDPILFRDPHGSGQLWIKRIVGLPGETIHIQEGDVWVNGARLVKNFQDQKRMRILVEQAQNQTDWHTSGDWSYASGYWTCSSRNDTVSLLQSSKLITDDLACNANLTRFANRVPDLMLSLHLSIASKGNLEIVMPGFRTELSSEWLRVLSVDNKLLFEQAVDLENIHLTLSSFDHSALVAVANQVVFHQPMPSGEGIGSLESLPKIISQGKEVKIWELNLWRDVYYTGAYDNATPATEPTKVARDCYFVLGDNPAVSIDSRNWGASASLPKSACLGVVAPSKD